MLLWGGITQYRSDTQAVPKEFVQAMVARGLSRGVAGRLPEEIRTRPDKANLSRPFTAFVLNEKNMVLREGLSIAGSDLVSWSNREGIRKLTESLDAGEAFLAYRLAVLALWEDRLQRGAGANSGVTA